jgi:transcriptional regulator with XRE-family HTH domain
MSLERYSSEHMERLNANNSAPARRLKLSKVVRRPPRTSVRIIRDLMLVFDQSDMTVAQLAKKLGVHSQTINNWRHGNAAPPLDQLEALAQVLGYRIVLAPNSARP